MTDDIDPDRRPSVFVVDDQDDTRSFIIDLLEHDEVGWTIAGEASSGEEAVRQVHRMHPDVVLLDYRMTGMNGLDTARTLLEEDPGQVILLVSGDVDRDMEARCAQVGIRGCLAKAELWRLTEVLRPYAGAPRRRPVPDRVPVPCMQCRHEVWALPTRRYVVCDRCRYGGTGP